MPKGKITESLESPLGTEKAPQTAVLFLVPKAGTKPVARRPRHSIPSLPYFGLLRTPGGLLVQSPRLRRIAPACYKLKLG